MRKPPANTAPWAENGLTATVGHAVSGPGARSLRARRAWTGRVFVLPVVIGTIIFNVLPMIPALALSFTSWDFMNPLQFIGLDNYVRLPKDAYFVESVQHTIVYTLGAVPGSMLAGLALAVLVNRKIAGMTFFRALFFLPVITSTVATGMVWRWIFDSKYGVVNAVAGIFGVDGPRWLGTPELAMVVIIVVSIWHSMGYNMVLFLAGLQGVPQHLYEAAEIDGAGRWRQFANVTLPLITPMILFVLIISVINSFQVFTSVYVITGGGPGFATAVYVYRLWVEAFRLYHMGYACAMSWLLFIVIALITFAQMKMANRWVFYG